MKLRKEGMKKKELEVSSSKESLKSEKSVQSLSWKEDFIEKE